MFLKPNNRQNYAPWQYGPPSLNSSLGNAHAWQVNHTYNQRWACKLFFKSANSWVRKFANFLSMPVRKSEKFKDKSANFYKIPHKSCWNSPKSRLFHDFGILYKFFIRASYSIFVRRKVCICVLTEVLSPEITKGLGPQIANPQMVTFAEGPQIKQIILVADSRFAEFICRQPIFFFNLTREYLTAWDIIIVFHSKNCKS